MTDGRWIQMRAPNWAEADRIGRQRQTCKEQTTGSSHDAVLRQVRPHDARHAQNVCGFAAEWAFADHFGLQAQLRREFDPALERDPGFDFIIGRTPLDVKACQGRPKWMPVPNSVLVKNTAEVFAMVWAQIGSTATWLVGAMSRRRVLKYYPVVENCYEFDVRRSRVVIPGRCVPVEDLDVDDFAAWVLRRTRRRPERVTPPSVDAIRWGP